MRNNQGQPQQRGQGNRGRQGPQHARPSAPGARQQGGQRHGRQEQGYEHPENRYREPSQSSGWRSQSGGWEDEDVPGFGDAFRGDEGSEQQRWDRWSDDQSFTEQQYGEGRDRYGDQGARGYYGGAGGASPGYGPGRYGFTGRGEFSEQGGRYGSFGGQGSQSYGGMGWRGERSQSRIGGMNTPGGMGTHQGGMQQQRFGRGPKGYKRSDERIKEDVSDRIHQLHDVDASDVELEVKNGEVTLTGTVPSRHMKWQLETLIDSVSGVMEVNNQLRIKREGSTSSGESSGGPGRK